MGFFSWRTQDTDRSICNKFSDRQPFTVIMTDDKGNQWVEKNYEGYGEFGGKDYHELVAEMNGEKPDRMIGIDMECSPEKFPGKTLIFPSLTEYGTYYGGIKPDSCEFQGFFYPDNSEEDDTRGYY
jgi:hypothetical protein